MNPNNLNTISILLILLTLLFVSSCGDDFQSNIEAYAADGTIDDSELSLIEDMVNEDPRLRRKYKDRTSILEKIDELNISVDLDDDGNDDLPIESNDPTKYKVYLENSGSMYGYINGRTELEEALMGLWTEIAKRGEELNINFVNDSIYPVKKEFEEFFEYLKPRNVNNIGKTSDSKIAAILNMVVKDVVPKEEPAIVLSDFIFSLEKGGKIIDQLSLQKYGLKSIVIKNKLIEKGIGVLVIKLRSKFDGRYYNYQNKPTVLKDTERPYYIWVIGKIDLIKEFPNRYGITKLKGYDHHTLLYSTENVETPYYTILKKTNLVGKFDKADRGKDQIIKIKNVSKSSRKDVFQFSVAADFSGIPVSEDYIRDIRNYQIDPNPERAYEIISVEKVSAITIKGIDKKIIEPSTHIITLSTQGIKSGANKLGISLLKKLPSWIEESSVDNDEDIDSLAGKTFGFKYLVEGINEGFTPSDHSVEKYMYLELILEK